MQSDKKIGTLKKVQSHFLLGLNENDDKFTWCGISRFWCKVDLPDLKERCT